MTIKTYELLGLVLFAGLAALPLTVPLVLGLRWLRTRQRGEGPGARRKLLQGAALAAILYAIVAADAFLVEPNWPELRTIEIAGPLQSELRVLHLSDLHLERELAQRDRWLIETVQRVAPDLILITGDIHQLGVEDDASLRRVLQYMNAPLGVFACGGYDNLDLLKRAAPNVACLDNATAAVRHGTDIIAIAGSPTGLPRDATSGFATSDYRIVLEHTPDRTRQAGAMGADLYLCGHTHGGQVRIPFWGAIVTNSETGKKFEGGLHSVGTMFIHTSRGLGLEPRPAPQVRFFCRPEITLIHIVPARPRAGGASNPQAQAE